jgi:hypothetical protein
MLLWQQQLVLHPQQQSLQVLQALTRSRFGGQIGQLKGRGLKHRIQQ